MSVLPTRTEAHQTPVLLVRAEAWYCALPVDSVRETCRPLPVQPIEGMPGFVRGISVLRGLTTPVLHLGGLLGGTQYRAGTRFVRVDLVGRPAALEVDEVIGMRRLSRTQLETSAPLLRGSLQQRADGFGVLDGALLAWLDSSRLVERELLDLVLSEGLTR